MEFGISMGALYAEPSVYVKYSREAEELGYSYAFYPDSQMVYPNPFAIMSVAATVTKKLRLGTMVSPPSIRHPSVLASAICTVHEISGGRALLTMGTGDSGVRKIGMKPLKLKELAEAVDYVKNLTEGKKFKYSTGEFGIRYAHGGIPIYTMATGPNMLKLSGKIGDGTIMQLGPGLTRWAVDQVRSGSQEAGVDFETRDLTWCALSSIDEDRNVARYRIKPSVTWFAMVFPQLIEKTGLQLGDSFWRRIHEMKENYEKYDLVHSDRWEDALEMAKFVPDELVDRMVLAGNPDDICRVMRDLEGLGISKVAIRPASTDDWYKTFRMFAECVMPNFR
ncbi:MAG TPA: LLM class flavin-dependent oxidoreductase [Nitrososphaerales archaeon]|nr:LLM class flavin-dependent oxidoreductase [Nitrososphaerales archaeon]